MRQLHRSKSRRDAQKTQDQQPADDEKSTQTHLSPFPIYQSPTVDTLDGSLIDGRRAYTPSRKAPRSADLDKTPIVRNAVSRPAASVNMTNASTPLRVPQRFQQPTNHRTTTGQSPVQQRPKSKNKIRRRKNRPRDFQIPEDMARVEVRTINVAERSAFSPIRPPSVDEWRQVARHTEQTKRNSIRKNISPSLQHLKLLHKMQIRSIRQLCFSPGLSLDTDPWNEELEGGKNINRRPHRSNNRDGRYRPIHPLKATMAVLPETPPVLSHRKCRLPTASDVGFPNPLPGEIDRKQSEIRLETQWEEASPRLIILITSDDLGKTVFDDRNHLVPDLHSWNQGGWDGLPFAGRELIMAKQRNYDVFEKKSPHPRRIWKANPTSMLAPPLDSTYSSTQDWKPRLIHDRPPGFTYVLACPTRIEFSIGNIEPLICSLSLYTLPPDGKKRKGYTYGKTSEDFHFPAGDWEGRVVIEAARRNDGSLDQVVIDTWTRRKHKGLFSYDPKLVENNSLYFVLQIFQLSPRNGSGLYTDHNSKGFKNHLSESTKKKSISHRIKSKLGKIGKSSNFEKADSIDLDSSIPRSESTHEDHGTKLLTPLCFGVVPLSYSSDSGHSLWPNGSLTEMCLYVFPTKMETEGEFLDRLVNIAAECPSDFNEDDPDHVIMADPTEELVPSKLSRFKSSRALKTALTKGTKKAEEEQQQTTRIIGSVTVFTSDLGMDFTQAMLSEPTALVGIEEVKKDSKLSRVLVDISGDCAIAINPPDPMSTSSGMGSETSRNKRSNLIRLPRATTPSGYADIADVRELLYLPPRPEKHVDVDSPISLQSTLNLLYIYPRLLRISMENEDIIANHSYSVRIRLIKSSVQVDASGQVESSQRALESFHNPAPWSGPILLDEVYTKVLLGKMDNSSNRMVSMIIRDEFKLRLPLIIDGTYFLDFRLLRICLSSMDADSGIDMQIISETMIPLSSSSNREASSGVRITTVIPNGSHRLKLGENLLLFDTRLVSSIHICDPTTATTLRDFPFAENESEEPDFPDKFTQLSLVPSRSIVGKLPSAEPIVDIKVPFYQLFANASESALLGQFPLLFHMHLCNLTNRFRYDFSLPDVLNRIEDGNDGVSVISGMKCEGRFIVENIFSLFEIIRKVKLMLARAEGITDDQISYFAKDFVDRFDEGILFHELKNGGQGGELVVESVNSSQMLRSRSTQSNLEKPPGVSVSQDGDFEDEIGDDYHNGGAVRLRAKDSLRTEFDIRISRTISAVSTKVTPFSRVAYGATKTDRMRIEAELNQEGSKFTHLLDDDETVIGSIYTVKDQGFGDGIMDMSRIEDSSTWGIAEDGTVIDGFSFHGENSVAGTEMPTGGFGEFSIAKRVRTAAQVIIAPCIAPSLSTTLTHGARKDDVEQPLIRRAAKDELARKISVDNASKHKVWVQPGSDSEEETIPRPIGSPIPVIRFRREATCHFITLTIGDLDEVEDNSGGWAKPRTYAYEAILMLWAKSWLDYTAEHGAQMQPGSYNRSEQETENCSLLVASFYAHKDLLLPLCLKSMALRCSSSAVKSTPPSPVIVDEYHMQILEPVIEMLCQGLMAEALSSVKDSDDQALAEALRSVDCVIDFLIGLSSIVHPQQQDILFTKFFKTLRSAEKENGKEMGEGFEWNVHSIRRVKSSRHLRLRAIEKLSVLASFLQANFPLKYSTWNPVDKEVSVSWNVQKAGSPDPIDMASTGNPYYDGTDWVPRSGWLACQLTDEALLICSLSCEAVVAEAMALAEITLHHKGETPTSGHSALQQRPGKLLKRRDLLLFQSMSVHAITCLHELLLRRHAMDSRYQSDQCQGRIAATFAPAILTKSIDSVRWLARMESTHKVRSLWLLCFMYILQEAPEAVLRTRLRSYCYPPDFSIHRVIRLLRLCSSTFQCLVGDTEDNMETDAENSKNLSSWLLQESFNIICATATLLVDECTIPISSYPREQKKIAQGILDLLLHILTIPQSAVTHFRSVGAALHSLTKFGAAVFFDVVGDSLQHWIRVILTLMNSISLSVRSISVDFVLSLLGETFKDNGNIDDISTMIATVLPEVIAREIALYSVSGLIADIDQIEKAVWPLRRALADVEEANPLDDARVDPQLSPILLVLCRSCQAIMDGVLIELRLRGPNPTVVGTLLDSTRKSNTFDADEESLFEAASFFPSETAALQKLRWLQTLKSLHESKGQWVEAAETLMLCAKTISDSIPHLRYMWRPSEFILWHDNRRSLWLGTIGKEIGLPDRGNVQVMEFAGGFLEPLNLFGESSKKNATRKFVQPTVSAMCSMLSKVTKEAVSLYLQEGGMDELAFSRLEDLLRVVMSVVEDHSTLSMDRSVLMGMASRQRLAEETAVLRRVSASMNADLTRLAERLALVTNEGIDRTSEERNSLSATQYATKISACRQYYVRVAFSGIKPKCFTERTTIPTYFDWDNPCIHRVPKAIVTIAVSAHKRGDELEVLICNAFAQSFLNALGDSIVFRNAAIGGDLNETVGSTFLDISLIHMDIASMDNEGQQPMVLESKRFFYRKSSSSFQFPQNDGLAMPQLLNRVATNLVELTVVNPFPCPLSRQRTLITSEFLEECA